MFTVTQNPEFTHDVPINVPVDDGHAVHKLRTRFRVLTADEIGAFDTTTHAGLTAFLEEAVVTFHDLADEADKPVECTPEIRARFLMTEYIRQGLMVGYGRAMIGARVGN